jgi:transposase-like protein
MIDINSKTAISYLQRLRMLIYEHSEHLELLEGEIEADEVILVADVKENEAEVWQERFLFLC